MRLSEKTHREVEDFLRVYFGDAQLNLPRIKVYGGWLGHFITKTLNIGAITLGNRIIVSPRLVGRDELGQVKVPGWLLAHECTHVMQYAQKGMLGFLASYLKEYFKTLCTTKRLNAQARNDAYHAIRHEQEARQAEAEYANWCAGRSACRVAGETGKEHASSLQHQA